MEFRGHRASVDAGIAEEQVVVAGFDRRGPLHPFNEALLLLRVDHSWSTRSCELSVDGVDRPLVLRVGPPIVCFHLTVVIGYRLAVVRLDLLVVTRHGFAVVVVDPLDFASHLLLRLALGSADASIDLAGTCHRRSSPA